MINIEALYVREFRRHVVENGQRLIVESQGSVLWRCGAMEEGEAQHNKII